MIRQAKIYVDEAISKLAQIGDEPDWRMIENDLIYARECLNIAGRLNKDGKGMARYFEPS